MSGRSGVLRLGTGVGFCQRGLGEPQVGEGNRPAVRSDISI